MDCLKYIVGLTDRDCDCLTPSVIESPSKSGFYIDDTFDGFSLIKLGASLNCKDEIFSVLDAARDKAISDFPGELAEQLSIFGMRALTGFSGTIGDTSKATKTFTASGTKRFYFRARTGNPQAMQIKIGVLGGFFTTASGLDVDISANGEFLETVHIDLTANMPTSSVVNLTLEGFDASGRPILYEIAYTLPVDLVYYNTQFHCGCSRSLPLWDPFLDYGTDFDAYGALNMARDMYGIWFSASVACGYGWLCNITDFKTDRWGRTMARTIQLMAILNAHKYFINSSRLNFFKINDTDRVIAHMGVLETNINERLSFLASEMPTQALGCWDCDRTTKKAEILV